MYNMIEQQLMQKRARLMGKLPETQRALDAVNLLIQKREADESVCLSSQSPRLETGGRSIGVPL